MLCIESGTSFQQGVIVGAKDGTRSFQRIHARWWFILVAAAYSGTGPRSLHTASRCVKYFGGTTTGCFRFLPKLTIAGSQLAASSMIVLEGRPYSPEK